MNRVYLYCGFVGAYAAGLFAGYGNNVEGCLGNLLIFVGFMVLGDLAGRLGRKAA